MIPPLSRWLHALGVDDDPESRWQARNAERLRVAGRVISMRAVVGRIEGRVQGSHARPHLVELGVPEWTPEQWRAVGEVLTRQARHYARLLAGQLPEQFDQVLETLDLSLIPRPSEWQLACTCRAPEPCLHQIALWMQVREQLDVDPYLLTRVRGRSREQLLAEIRDQRASAEHDRLDLEAFGARGWAHTSMQPTEVPLPPVRGPRTPAGPLRMLGDPPGWAGPASAVALFAPAVEAAARRARALLDDDHDRDERPDT
jgi:uncharacterized Zn finger protein